MIPVYGIEINGFIGKKPNNKIKDKREEIKSEVKDKSLRFSCSTLLRKRLTPSLRTPMLTPNLHCLTSPNEPLNVNLLTC